MLLLDATKCHNLVKLGLVSLLFQVYNIDNLINNNNQINEQQRQKLVFVQD